MQFGLKAAFYAIVVCALVLANRRYLFSAGLQYFHFVLPLVSVTGFLLGARLQVRVLSGRWYGPLVLQTSLLVVTGAIVWTLWARYRWLLMADDGLGDDLQPWPYPDELLIAFHDWLDKELPPRHGALKLSGEIYLVTSLIDFAALTLCASLAVLLGMRWPLRRLPENIDVARPRSRQ